MNRIGIPFTTLITDTDRKISTCIWLFLNVLLELRHNECQNTNLKHFTDAFATLSRCLKILETSALCPQPAFTFIYHTPFSQVDLQKKDTALSTTYTHTHGLLKSWNGCLDTTHLLHISNSLKNTDLVGTNDKNNALHIGLGAHLLLHLCQPAV